MLRKSKKQPQTVADKVSKLLAHPNESDSAEDSDFDVATGPKLADFEEGEYDLPDARSTSFRKRNVKLLSEESSRYKGKISSRKELEEEDEDEEDSEGEEQNDSEEEEDEEAEDELPYEESDDEEEDDSAMTAFIKKIKAGKDTAPAEEVNGDSEDDSLPDPDDDSEEDNSDEEDGEESDEEDDDDDDDDDEDEDGEDDTIKPSDVMSKTNHEAEIKKGVCVQNQLRIWERLLELRINTQKFTSKANQLPAPETLKSLGNENPELQTVLDEAQERSSKLLQQLLALQSALHQQNSEMRKSVKRKQPDENESSPPKRFGSVLQSNFQQMTGYRNDVLLKWDDRTKLLTPGAGVKRKSVQEDYDIIKKIDSALANREVLVEKSQTPKNNQPEQQLQENAPPQRLTHIYDDTDFYHQQLRELIEYKASTASNMSEITKQFVELQKLRQKMKKKVDTRASKGRKLRYVVHKKLANFMAPNEASDWTDSAKSELYKSLFV